MLRCMHKVVDNLRCWQNKVFHFLKRICNPSWKVFDMSVPCLQRRPKDMRMLCYPIAFAFYVVCCVANCGAALRSGDTLEMICNVWPKECHHYHLERECL